MFDMGAIDLLRARERGVPRYNEFRRQLGLNPIRSFADLTDDEHYRRKLTELYGEGPEGVEKLDLLIGTLAETNRPTGFGFGETMFQIFILNATRRLQADRFYTDDYGEEVYTKEGLRWVDESSLKRVILRHFPQLEQSGLGNIKNAFEPWDIGTELDPDRHPLREFDSDLKDPWQGDAAATSPGRMSTESEGAELGEGWQEHPVGGTDETEADEFRRLAAEIQEIQRILAKQAGFDRVDRVQHAKMQAGVTNAVFRVEAELPPGLAAGIFRPAAQYESWVRFSNASGLNQPDPDPDLRGLAFRVFSGEGNQVATSNDFLMTDAPVSHARDAGQFVAYARANTANSKPVMVLRLIRAVGLREAIRILKNLRDATRRPVRSLADESYWSRAPFQLGQKAIRYHVRPADGPENSDQPVGTSPNYLREELESRLRAGPVVFDFFVQRYVDEEKTPIENGAAAWSETDALPVRIAQLHIPQQDLASPEAVAAAEAVDALAFSPWTGAGTLRPLGALNRARRPVYAASQDLRT